MYKTRTDNYRYPNWFNEISATMLISGIRNVGYKVYHNQDLSSIIYRIVDDGIHLFKSLQIANVLLALNQMKASWSNLSDKLQSGLLSSVRVNLTEFNAQSISTALLSLSRLTYLSEDIELLLVKRAIELKGSITQDELDVSQICLALTWIKPNSGRDYSDLSDGLNPVLFVRESKLQQEVSEMLLLIYPNMIAEHRLGINGVISVDCYIPETNCIIEVNGPSHYYHGGSLNHKSIENKQLLEKMGYTVKFVSYQDWDTRTNRDQRQAYLNELLGLNQAESDYTGGSSKPSSLFSKTGDHHNPYKRAKYC